MENTWQFQHSPQIAMFGWRKTFEATGYQPEPLPRFPRPLERRRPCITILKEAKAELCGAAMSGPKRRGMFIAASKGSSQNTACTRACFTVQTKFLGYLLTNG